MPSVFVKLFTRDVLTDPAQGRALIRLIDQYVPSWARTATGEAHTRVGPYSTLASVELEGEQNRALDVGALADFVQECGQALDLRSTGTSRIRTTT